MLIEILDDELDSEILFEQAIRENLMIRDCSTFPFLSNKFIRFCFMNPEDNDKLVEVLNEINIQNKNIRIIIITMMLANAP